MAIVILQCKVGNGGQFTAKHTSSTDPTIDDVYLAYNSATVKTKSTLRAAIAELLNRVEGSSALTA